MSQIQACLHHLPLFSKPLRHGAEESGKGEQQSKCRVRRRGARAERDEGAFQYPTGREAQERGVERVHADEERSAERKDEQTHQSLRVHPGPLGRHAGEEGLGEDWRQEEEEEEEKEVTVTSFKI